MEGGETTLPACGPNSMPFELPLGFGLVVVVIPLAAGIVAETLVPAHLPGVWTGPGK